MTDSIEEACPLCGQAAESEPIENFGRTKHFRCPVCTEFIISLSGERLLGGPLSGRRENLSRTARTTTASQILHIHRGTAEQGSDLVAEIVPKARFGL